MLLEQADRNLATDIGFRGIISGATPTQHEPVPDLTIDLTGPSTAYDRLGQRIFIGTDSTVDLSLDHQGIPTAVQASGNERWLGVFIRFDRKLSDLRIDGNGQQVYWRRDEAFEFVVRQEPEAAIGTATRVPIQADELLVCEVRLEQGQSDILDAHIEQERRQVLTFAPAAAIGVDDSEWGGITPAGKTVQAALDAIDDLVIGHRDGVAVRHGSDDIDHVPDGFVTEETAGAAINEIALKLGRTTAVDPGAHFIGAAAKAGNPHGLPATRVENQLESLLDWLNAHESATTNAHAAAAIQSVARSGSPYSLSAGSVLWQTTKLLEALNAVAADLAAHHHDDAYLSRLYTNSLRFEPGQSRVMTTLPSSPDIVTVGYNRYDSSGAPQATTYARGSLTPDIRYWVKKVDAGGNDKAFEVGVFNNSSVPLLIFISAFGRIP